MLLACHNLERQHQATPRPLHVAIVDEELPYPPTSGKRIRTLNLVLRLARRHRLTYLCQRNADADEARQAAAFFADNGVAVRFADRAVPKKSVLAGGLPFYAGLAANLFSPRPYVVDVNFSRSLRRLVADFAAGHDVDLWQCEWTPYFEVLRGLVGRRCLVMAHNVESLIWQRYVETETNALKRWYIRRQWRKFEAFERRTFAEAGTVVTVSRADAAMARERYGARRLAVVDNGVDTGYFQPADRPREPERLLFLGSLDWRPNLDAVRLLLERIFPAVRAAEPAARLSIVGRNAPGWLVEQSRRQPGVELAVNVPDVRPYLAQAGMLAVPLRIGGGSRLKILEALACGLPVVSTRIGAEGLELEPGRHLVVTDQVEEMTPALVQQIREPAPGLALAEAGRQRVLQRYDWDVLAGKLEQVWADCLNHCAGSC